MSSTLRKRKTGAVISPFKLTSNGMLFAKNGAKTAQTVMIATQNNPILAPHPEKVFLSTRRRKPDERCLIFLVDMKDTPPLSSGFSLVGKLVDRKEISHRTPLDQQSCTKNRRLNSQSKLGIR